MILVDELQSFTVDRIANGARKHGKQWCHMSSDTNDIVELKEFAVKTLGLKEEYFQPHKVHPHFDLTPSMREKALANGAIYKSAREQAKERMIKTGLIKVI